MDDAKNVGTTAGGKEGEEDDDDNWADDTFDDFQSAPPAAAVVDAAATIGSGSGAIAETSTVVAELPFPGGSSAGSQLVKPPETHGPSWNLDIFMGGSAAPAAGVTPARLQERGTKGMGGLLSDDRGASAREGQTRRAGPMDLIR